MFHILRTLYDKNNQATVGTWWRAGKLEVQILSIHVRVLAHVNKLAEHR
jgi:hypothetical protein